MNQLPKQSGRTFLLALALAFGAASGHAAAPAGTPAVAAPAEFARVGDTVITHEEYALALNAAARAKFYHGKAPDNELAKLQRKVGEQMVDRILLVREARRRGLHPDAAEVKKTVQSYEQRYAASEQWKARRDQVLPPLIERLEQDSLLRELEKSVRAAAVPGDSEVRAYYAAHPEQFTEPEQLRVAAILLKVDPSAPSATWAKTEEQAQALARRVRAGEDFAALAKRHSGDASAAKGGDMGYLHGGMLAEEVQQAMGKLKPGQSTDALRVLQGVGVFRLIERKPARLHAFESVKVRARELTQREQGERAWTELAAALRASTPSRIDQSRFLPLEVQAGARATPE
ncbi:MAG: peptidylprolyl isomerase [Telluria sp.]|nr:peptidylprolyl isomerase [Telluria sp.]